MPAPATYPGWEKFGRQVDELKKGVDDDKIPIKGEKLTRAQLAKRLHDAAKAVPADERCPCPVPTAAQVVEALKHPTGKDYDWKRWSAHWKGHWWDDEGKASGVAADWLKPEQHATAGEGAKAQDAEGMAGVPPNDPKCHKQDAVFRKSDADDEVDRRGWNASDGERDYVWGWDPKSYGKDWEKAVHIGYPFDNGKCHCILWICSVDAYLECLSPENDCYSIVALDGHGLLRRTGEAKPAR